MKYKLSQDNNTYEQEIREFLDKLDVDEAEIAEMLRDHDDRGMRHEGLEGVRKNLADEDFDHVKVRNVDIADDDEEDLLEESYYQE